MALQTTDQDVAVFSVDQLDCPPVGQHMKTDCLVFGDLGWPLCCPVLPSHITPGLQVKGCRGHTS